MRAIPLAFLRGWDSEKKTQQQLQLTAWASAVFGRMSVMKSWSVHVSDVTLEQRCGFSKKRLQKNFPLYVLDFSDV